MKRKTTQSANGNTEALLAESGITESWILVVSSSAWSGMSMILQASIDNVIWFTATNVSGSTTFTENSAVLLTPGLYYRGVVSDYSNPLTLEIKPTKRS